MTQEFTYACQCEHEVHGPQPGDEEATEENYLLPKLAQMDPANDGHDCHHYGKHFPAGEIEVVLTIYGRYQLCRSCKAAMPKEFFVTNGPAVI